MAAKRKPRKQEAQLAFEALSIEGGLLLPEWLARVAQLQAAHQTEADYGVPKGLNLRDEIGRYWRIAQAHWKEFDAGLAGGSEPRALAERFVLALLRDCFGFATLAPLAPVAVGERSFPIGFSAQGMRIPVVIAPADQGLETPLPELGDAGRRRTAFGLAQEYLNAMDEALWGLVSDGKTLRILRDNASLTRPAWVEADLARIFTEGRYADFAALWLLAHESRFGKPGQPATDCALELWREAGRELGTRARAKLRGGVEAAIVALGQGFYAHPENQALRAALESGTLSIKDYFNQLLRLVYRLIFLLTVEERGLLHPDGTDEKAKALYAQGYGMRRLRERAIKRSAHDRYADLWESSKIVWKGLATGEPRLGLPALAGIFAADQCAALDTAKIENGALLLAIWKLAWLKNGGLERVNWRDMGPEELGSVYESLLELVPQISGGRSFGFAEGGETKGNARKTSGSYYTPDSLVQVLLDSALDPVIVDTIAKHPDKPVDALLGLSIVDPACGSGHFLLAAARRLAAQVARLEAGGTPSAGQYRHALRQVVGRCVYGVDLNPMAVELCRVSLWMEAVEPGRPLSFLDSHIQQGNALLGTTPELMAKGIPDAAWEPIEGDDKKVASALKKRNKAESKGQRTLDFSPKGGDESAQVSAAVKELDAASDADAESLAAKGRRWQQLLFSDSYRHQRLVADAWCAAFVWPKQPGPLADAAPTNELWRQLRDGQAVPDLTLKTTTELAKQYSFFQWHLQFPQVFAKGGFDVVLGNPPWEELTPSAKEFFAVYDASIWSQDKSGEEAVTRRLLESPNIAAAWSSHCRRLFGIVHSLKASGRYVLFAPGNLGKGDFNVYRMFVETAMSRARIGGFAAQIVPETLYSGATTMAIRRELFERFDWGLLIGFENSGEGWFKGVHKSARFCLYAAKRGEQTQSIRVAFNVRSEGELIAALASRSPVRLTPSTIRSFSPEALSIMELNSSIDLELATRMHSAWPAFGNDERLPPSHKHMRELDMTNDRALFLEHPPGLPLYEGRMVGLFDHRAKGYRSGKARTADWVEFSFSDPEKRIQPQFFVRQEDLPDKLGTRPFACRAGFCNIASPTNERTLVATLIPPGSVCGNKVPTIMFDDGYEWFGAFWVGVANSFAMDFLARKKVSLTMTNTIVDSLPFPRLARDDRRAMQIVQLAARLCCVGREMQTYWDRLANDGWVGRLDTEKDGLTDEGMRAVVEAEIDAMVAREIFGLSGTDLAHILDTFPIVEKRDRKVFGEYRTKRVILEIYDAMAEAARTGKPYQSCLDPPPADPRVAHAPRPGVLGSPAEDDRLLPDAAWARPCSDDESEAAAAIAAILKTVGQAKPSREVRLAATLALDPRILLPFLSPAQESTWRRLVGSELAPAPAGVTRLVPPADRAWGAAVRHLRGNGLLVEDLSARTWAPGPGLTSMETEGWPDGRARFVLDVIQQRGEHGMLEAMPDALKRWIDAAAA